VSLIGVLTSDVFEFPGVYMGYFHGRMRVTSAKKLGPYAFPTVKGGESCTFGNFQISSRNLEKLEEKMNHFLHARKEDVFIRCKTFHTYRGYICR
jgi:hypothetical protein